MNFEMPQDLIDGYDYPPITRELKRKILGENIAALYGVNIEEQKAKLKDDEWSRLRATGKAKPWSAHRKRVNAPGYANPGYELA